MAGEERRILGWCSEGEPTLLKLGKLHEEMTNFFDLTNNLSRALESLRKKYNAGRFEISAEVRLAKGNELTIAMNQNSIIGIVFGVNLLNSEVAFCADVRTATYNADIEEEEIIGVRIISTDKIDTGNQDVLVVSQKLAEMLDIGNGARIVISGIYQDMDKVNLDELLKKPEKEEKKSTDE